TTAVNSRPRPFIAQLPGPASSADCRALTRAGAHVTRRYQNLPMVALTAPGTALSRLAALPQVRHLTPDLTVKGAMEYAVPAVGANQAQQSGWTGLGVGIAVIDSGINWHDDLATDRTSVNSSRIIAGYDFLQNRI